MTDTTMSSSPTRAVGLRDRLESRLRARDLLNVAIFVVLYIVVVFVVSMLGIVSPLMMVLTLPLVPVAAGIPYMLFLTRVRHPGVITLFGVVFAVASMSWGFAWQAALVIIVFAIIAEIPALAGRYRSKWASIVTYTIFSAWMIGPWIPMFLDPIRYFGAQEAQYGARYVAEMHEVLTVPIVLATWAAGIACAFLGGLLGTSVLRKHFRRAGLA